MNILKDTNNLLDFLSFDEELPCFARKFVNKGDNLLGREKLMRILLKTPQLINKGFDLPTTKLAMECGVSVPSVSKWLKQLTMPTVYFYKDKRKIYTLLELIDTKIIVGSKSKTYKARGPLLDFLELREKV